VCFRVRVCVCDVHKRTVCARIAACKIIMCVRPVCMYICVCECVLHVCDVCVRVYSFDVHVRVVCGCVYSCCMNVCVCPGRVCVCGVMRVCLSFLFMRGIAVCIIFDTRIAVCACVCIYVPEPLVHTKHRGIAAQPTWVCVYRAYVCVCENERLSSLQCTSPQHRSFID
jgi:hypothetical protein